MNYLVQTDSFAILFVLPSSREAQKILPKMTDERPRKKPKRSSFGAVALVANDDEAEKLERRNASNQGKDARKKVVPALSQPQVKKPTIALSSSDMAACLELHSRNVKLNVILY